MWRLFNSFLAILTIMVVLKWFLPSELSDLATEILIKVLTLIKFLLEQVSLV